MTDSHSIFSQWYPAQITINGKEFCCNEQYMMWSKAILFNDSKIADEIMKTTGPKKIKDLGRKVKNFNEEVWEKNREEIVYKANYAKFTQHEDLKEELLATGNKVLIEASPYDKIWGIGIGPNDEQVLEPDKWKGLNLLGKSIMKVREELR